MQIPKHAKHEDEYLRVDDHFNEFEHKSVIPKIHLPTQHWMSTFDQLKSAKDARGAFRTKEEACRYIKTKFTPMFMHKGVFISQESKKQLTSHIRTSTSEAFETNMELQIVRR